MKLVIGIVRPDKTNEVLEALYRAEVRGFSMSRVQGHGGELDRVETRLAQRNLRWAERSRLEEQRQSLRQQVSALSATTGEQEQRLATVPIQFRYGSGALAPGPGRGPTVGEATARAANNFLGALKVLLILFVSISPWVLTGLLGWLGFRAWRKRRPADAAPGA